MKGTIKFYNNKEGTGGGFGFITTEDGRELFFHVSNVLEGTDTNLLDKGTVVTFEEGMGKKGPQAVNVTLAEGGAVAMNSDEDDMDMAA